MALTSNGEQCFSGGIDSTIQWWNIPSSNVDPYDTYGEKRFISHGTVSDFCKFIFEKFIVLLRPERVGWYAVGSQ